MKNFLFASLACVFLLPISAQDIVIDGVRQGWLNHNWDLVGKELIVRNGTPYIRVDTVAIVAMSMSNSVLLYPMVR